MKDFNDGTAAKYKTKPRELRAWKPEYQCFRPDVFAKHYNRELRRQKEEVGWQHRQNLKGSKTNITKHDCLQTVEAESAGVSPPTEPITMSGSFLFSPGSSVSQLNVVVEISVSSSQLHFFYLFLPEMSSSCF